MNLRTRLTRSNGYRELGMYDESILELENIQGEDWWRSEVIDARYKTYRDAKEWELAKTMAELLYERKPSSFKWCKNLVDSMTECGDPTGALQLLHDSSKRFGNDAKYIFALGRQYALLCEIEEAKKYVSGLSKRTVLLRLNFLMILRLMRCGIVFDDQFNSFFINSTASSLVISPA